MDTNKKIKITRKLIKYLEENHGGLHCKKYWVLSRIVAKKDNNGIIEISEEECLSIPKRFLEKNV